MIEQTIKSNRLDTLRRRINDEAYLHAAIQRMALVMSRELMDIQRIKDAPYQRCGAHSVRKAGENEQQRKRQK